MKELRDLKDSKTKLACLRPGGEGSRVEGNAHPTLNSRLESNKEEKKRRETPRRGLRDFRV